MKRERERETQGHLLDKIDEEIGNSSSAGTGICESKKNYVLVNPVRKDAFLTMLKAEWLCYKINKTPLWRIKKRNRMIKRLFGSIDGNPYNVQSPIHIAWGVNMHIGKNLYSGPNFTVMDHVDVKIGDNCFLAPNVTISTEYHPRHPDDRRVLYLEDSFEPERRTGIEVNMPVTIGNDVYIASGVIVSAGVTIGDGCVIGAGSVVTRDIPPFSFACGVPCRVVCAITDEDRITDEIQRQFGLNKG